GLTTYGYASNVWSALPSRILAGRMKSPSPGGFMSKPVSLPPTTFAEQITAFAPGSISDVREVVFVDPSITDLDVLLQGMRADVEVNLLSPSEPALLQMARVLACSEDLEVIHVIAHGRSGEVSFAAGILSAENLEAHRPALSNIGAALSPDGEIRLW